MLSWQKYMIIKGVVNGCHMNMLEKEYLIIHVTTFSKLP